ncbi:helix-turn-helix domain-containing protein [Clostridium merdae]|uniref:helix-turn-helix domain-containing protein n=1 Tax=Clostridium merdae TaxID=1958780 RepID=UPI000A26C8DD|nr:helix-turn-helix domain-containing protein [Clostridium merdae]
MQFYTVEQLAKMFNKSSDTIRRKIRAGEFGDTLNDGKAHMVSESGLQAYIKKHTGPAEGYRRNFSGSKKRSKVKFEPLRKLTLEDVMSS